MPRPWLFRNEKGRPEDRPLFWMQGKAPYAEIASFDFLATRRRANSPAAAAPNSNTMGGAGTSVPPVEPPVDPPLDEDELEDEDEELLLEEEAPEDVPPNEDEVLPPKLDEPPLEDEDPEDEELEDEEPLEPELPDEPLEPLLPPEPP